MELDVAYHDDHKFTETKHDEVQRARVVGRDNYKFNETGYDNELDGAKVVVPAYQVVNIYMKHLIGLSVSRWTSTN